ncbi:uncharacterized protein LOC144167878 [Haemaphysalis longicornis]
MEREAGSNPTGASAAPPAFAVTTRQRDPPFFYGLRGEDVDDWLDTYVRKLRKAFGSPAHRSDVAKRKLSGRIQPSEETYASYIEDVVALCRRVDESMPEADKDARAPQPHGDMELRAIIREIIREELQLHDQPTLPHDAFRKDGPQLRDLVKKELASMTKMISMYIRPDHTNWDAILPFVTFAYNTGVQKTTGYSPFLLVYGRDPSFMLDASVLSAPVYSSSPLHEEFISRLNYCRQLASLNTAASQRDRKDRYDASHRTVLFRPGDEALLWTPTRKPELCEKFLHGFTGPYTILEETSPVNYRVTPCSAPVDRRYRGTEIVHVSRLKPFVRRSS